MLNSIVDLVVRFRPLNPETPVRNLSTQHFQICLNHRQRSRGHGGLRTRLYSGWGSASRFRLRVGLVPESDLYIYPQHSEQQL